MKPKYTEKKNPDGTGVHGDTMTRFDLLPPESLLRASMEMDAGAKRGRKPNDWRYIGRGEHIDHAIRHIMLFLLTKEQKHLSRASVRVLMANAFLAEDDDREEQTATLLGKDLRDSAAVGEKSEIVSAYLCYPLSDTPDARRDMIKQVALEMFTVSIENKFPLSLIVPHLNQLFVIEDSNNRKSILDMCKRQISTCEVLVNCLEDDYGHAITDIDEIRELSDGMAQEIDYAKRIGVTVITRQKMMHWIRQVRTE